MSRLFLSRNLVWKRRARRLHRAGLRRLPLHRVQPALAIRRPVAGDDPPPPCCPACLPACLSAPHHPSSVCSHARCVSCPGCPADSSTRRHHRADTSPSWAVACCRVHGGVPGVRAARAPISSSSSSPSSSPPSRLPSTYRRRRRRRRRRCRSIAEGAHGCNLQRTPRRAPAAHAAAPLHRAGRLLADARRSPPATAIEPAPQQERLADDDGPRGPTARGGDAR
jgi:hypothetical protein